MPPKDSDDPFGLRPNAPVSLVRAAKASLKEPTRPVTPSDYGRQLFPGSDPNSRPSTSYASAGGSKTFYHEQGPKLALPRLDPARPDTAALRPLSGHHVTPSTDLRDNRGRSPLSGSGGSSSKSQPEALLPGQRHGRPTAAETVATLKAGLAAGNPAMLYGDATSFTSQPSLCPIENDGDGPTLDPRRNDDLPTRPTTSRGRPSSSTGEREMDPIHVTERIDGAPAGMQEFTGGGQVLDFSKWAQYSDDEDTDFNECHISKQQRAQQAQVNNTQHQLSAAAAASQARPPMPSSPPQQQQHADTPASHPKHLQASMAQHDILSTSSSSRSSHPPATQQQQQQQQPQQPASPQQLPLQDASEAFFVWRADVERCLTELSACIASAGRSVTLAQHTGTLLGHVQHVRTQTHPSRWLNSPSAVFSDARGAALSMREAISEHVFQLMDSNNSQVLVQACAIVLRVVKSRQPLLQASKTLYRLSKDSSNDALFRAHALLEPLVHTVHVMVASSATSTTPSSMHESLVYLNGCLKNISNDASNQKALVKLGALQVLSALLHQLATQVEANVSCTDSCGQVAVQVTGVLRNLAVSSASAGSFVSAGVLPAMRAAAKVLWAQSEVVLNVGRVLSKLTLAEACTCAMEEDWDYAPLLVRLLGRHADNRAILLRIAFVLGNLTTHSNEYRRQVALVPGSLATVVSILEQYVMGEGQEQASQAESDVGKAAAAKAGRLARAAPHEDCLTKVLRLAANLAIHADVGPSLAGQRSVAGALLHVLSRHSVARSEELVLNAVCALTNLSFYMHDGASGFTNQVLALEAEQLLCHVTPLLLCENEEAVVEAARAFGNFSRLPAVREYMLQARVLDALVLLLDHGNAEVLYSVCGTLINFLMDPCMVQELVSRGGVRSLIDVLGRMAALEDATDMELAVTDVACKALFNIAVEANKRAAAGSSGSDPRATSSGRAAADSQSMTSPELNFSGEELEAALLVLEHLEASSALQEEEGGGQGTQQHAGPGPGMGQDVAHRLATQLQRLQARLASLELEDLPGPGA